MKTIPYSHLRQNADAIMDKVCEDHAPVIVARQNKPPVVMMALEDYTAIEETFYLLRNPKNAMRLMKAVRNVEKKRYKKQALAEA